MAGDQQASLVVQGCTRPGLAKVTFGTGAMLDCCVGEHRPTFSRRGDAGTFPIIAWQEPERLVWGIEAIMLSAGTCVEWLCRGLEVLSSPEESDLVAASVTDTGGVVFAPSLSGA